MHIQSIAELRELYSQPSERAIRKQIAVLDVHSRRFVALSPFVVMSTCDAGFNLDASPRGGAPGFVKIGPDGHLLIPDAPGNNRLDSLENIVSTGKVGLLFMVPGFDETLRVNGSAVLSVEQTDIQLATDVQREPKLVVRVSPDAVYFHCAKAFLRSKLWSEASRVDRNVLPTLGQMINDQTGTYAPLETREDMERRYARDL